MNSEECRTKGRPISGNVSSQQFLGQSETPLVARAGLKISSFFYLEGRKSLNCR